MLGVVSNTMRNDTGLQCLARVAAALASNQAQRWRGDIEFLGGGNGFVAYYHSPGINLFRCTSMHLIGVLAGQDTPEYVLAVKQSAM